MAHDIRHFINLTEAYVILERQNYPEMFAGVLKQVVGFTEPEDKKGLVASTIEKMIDKEIRWAKQYLKRNDRIIWYLRIYRLFLIKSYLDDEGYQKAKAKVQQKIGTKINDADLVNAQMHGLKTKLEHYLSMDIADIQTHQFSNEGPSTLLSLFKNLEDEWKATKSEDERYVEIKEGDTLIIKLNDKQGWWLLDRNSCPIEANAMGHCGNVPTAQAGERILSFRSKRPSSGKENIWKPHLTFILDRHGYLGEMKGRGNEKPADRYHAAIIKLLENDIITGIKGGGYEPESNFDLLDLSREEIDRLAELKPALGTLKFMYSKMGPSEAVIIRCIKTIESSDLPFVRFDSKKFILEEYKDIKQFSMSHEGNLDHYIDLVTEGSLYGQFEPYIDDDIVEEFFNDLSDEDEKLVKAKFKKFDIDKDEEYDSIYEVVTHNELDEIKDAATSAIYDGKMVGAEGEMFDAVKTALEDLSIPYGGGGALEAESGHFLDGPVSITMTIEQTVRLLSDDEQFTQLVEEGAWLPQGVEIDEPSYGWDGYDEATALDRFRENLDEV